MEEEHAGGESAITINSPLLNKIWDGVFSRIGIGAIFLAIAYLIFIKWDESQKIHEEQWKKTFEASEKRFEMMWDKSQGEREKDMEAILKCCADRIYEGARRQ